VAYNTATATTTNNSLSEGSTVNNEERADHDATNEEEDVLDGIQIEGSIEEQANPEDMPNNDFCFTEDDFLESITKMNDSTRHRGVWHNAWKEINGLEGEEVVCQIQKEGRMKWKVIKAFNEGLFKEIILKETDLLQKIIIANIPEDSASDSSTEANEDYCDMFWKLWPQEIGNELEKLNKAIIKENVTNKSTYKRVMRIISQDEYVIFHALLIGTSRYV